MRIMIKGGVWKNTEDEILKAAVMKYGLNQWARISSLLVRKSAKQCKARWYEWLDPSIKKTEWSQEEDEKLLHLAKIMPCQWRSIAPIVGRTSAQCLQRYENLLDSVSNLNVNDNDNDNDNDVDQLINSSISMSNASIRRLRPGEIDPNPETKPARPDAIDMDEDEKEMLSEARARLANTKGKKAKRKAREKQLAQARRLASLQKRRELKAAGIHLKKKKKKKYKYIDYNNEIPFYRKTPRGFYDTTKDDLLSNDITKKARNSFKPMFITDIEGERRDDIEERERKKDIQRQKLLKKINLPELIKRLNTNNNLNYKQKRKELDLPKPQITQKELQDIAKLSNNINNNDNDLTLNLMDNTPRNNLSMLRTPNSYNNGNSTNTPNMSDIRTPSNRGNNILEQARNAYKMKNTNTPLLGGDNVKLMNDDWSGITPKLHTVSTPNINTPNIATASAIGTGTGTGTVDHGASIASNVSNMSNVSRISSKSLKKQNKKRKRKLRDALNALPEPEYEYDIQLPPKPVNPFKPSGFIPDAADVDAQLIEQDILNKAEELKKRSYVIQNGLPIPKKVNPSMELTFIELYDKSADLQNASDLIRDEMMNIIYYDINNPLQPIKKKRKLNKNMKLKEYSNLELLKAKKLLENELNKQIKQHTIKDKDNRNGNGNGKEEMDDDNDDNDDDNDVLINDLSDNDDQCLFIPRLRGYKYVSWKNFNDKLEAKKQEFNIIRQQCNKQKIKKNSIIKKINIKCGGYNKIQQNLLNKKYELENKLNELNIEYNIYDDLQKKEINIIPQRIKKWNKFILKEKERQSKLQLGYDKLQNEYDGLLSEPNKTFK